MQGFAERKKTEQKLLEEGEEKKQPMAPRALSMSEGPMGLTGKDIEQWGRKSFEKSVKIELEALTGKKKAKKGKKKGKRRKKIKIR